jgi:hypothetical protein
MEHIHYLLTLGMIPNLYQPQDWEDMKNNSGSEELANMTLDAFINMFKRNLQDNLRIFMTFSPLGEKLREYVRIYPSILDHTTCLCFTDWPETALKEVANKFIEIENIIIQTDDDDDPKKKVKKGEEEEEKEEEKKEEVKEEEKEGEEGEEGNKEINVDEEEKRKKNFNVIINK